MRSHELRALQTPLKERHRADPEAADVTLSATGELGEGISCSVKTGSALASAGLHPASGGDGNSLGDPASLRPRERRERSGPRHSPAPNRALLRRSPDDPSRA
jgi:hypothetical protein